MNLKIRGIKRQRGRKGEVYWYHRKTGTRLPGVPGSTAFMDALAAAEAAWAGRQPVKPGKGTLGAIIADYRASPEWANHKPRTRKDYQKIFDFLQPLDSVPMERMDAGYLYAARDKWFKRRKRRFTNYVLQVLSMLFTWARKRSKISCPNPLDAVEKIKRPKNARLVNRAWSDAEVATVLAEAPPELQLPIALAAYAGFRLGDVIRLPWSAYDGVGITIRPAKNDGIDDEPMWVPVHQELKPYLDRAPRRSPVMVVGVRSERPYTENGLQRRFFELIRRLVAEDKVAPGLTFHGLRHTLGKHLGEAGADARTIADMLGQRTTKMGEHYSRQANRKHQVVAAVTALETRQRR